LRMICSKSAKSEMTRLSLHLKTEMIQTAGTDLDDNCACTVLAQFNFYLRKFVGLHKTKICGEVMKDFTLTTYKKPCKSCSPKIKEKREKRKEKRTWES